MVPRSSKMKGADHAGTYATITTPQSISKPIAAVHSTGRAAGIEVAPISAAAALPDEPALPDGVALPA